MTAPFQLLGQWISAAHAANMNGQFDAAAGLCKQALKVAPNLPEAWYNLAVAQRGLGRKPEAQDAVSYTHLDVYKRQAMTSVDTRLKAATATISERMMNIMFFSIATARKKLAWLLVQSLM